MSRGESVGLGRSAASASPSANSGGSADDHFTDRVLRRPALISIAVLAALISLTPVAAADGSGGAAAFSEPELERIDCVAPKGETCSTAQVPAGALVRMLGTDLRRVRQVVFRGGSGTRDDVKARVTHAGTRHADVQVPGKARTGPLDLVVRGGTTTRAVRRLVVETLALPAAQGESADHVFPIQGRHDVGQSETNNFGGGRGHQGQDMFAACGTPMVAAQGGTVRIAKANHPRAGNYLVITGATSGLDYVYMHLQAPPTVETGDPVLTGQPLGAVGDSGNASGCHLHFELWSSPGWYRGGSPMDPLPHVREWDPDH